MQLERYAEHTRAARDGAAISTNRGNKEGSDGDTDI